MPRGVKPTAATVATQQATILKLSLDGLTVREIADHADVNLPKSTVQDRLDDALAELVLPAADQVRLMELARLDRWQRRLEQRLADDEDPVRVVPVALKVQERRSRLLGLDAPERAEMTVHQVDTADLALAELVNEAKARNARALAEIEAGE